MNHDHVLRRRIRAWTIFFIIGLVISGVTAIPLVAELDFLSRILKLDDVMARSNGNPPAWASWLSTVHLALRKTDVRYPFAFYGTDWLAFGHFVVALAYVGALRDPVRNKWLFVFGQLACVAVLPYAFVMGGIRQIPWWWRLIDCAFGVIGFVPNWLCLRYANQLEKSTFH